MPGGSFANGREEKGDQKGGDGKPKFLHIVPKDAKYDHQTYIEKGVGNGVRSNHTKEKYDREKGVPGDLAEKSGISHEDGSDDEIDDIADEKPEKDGIHHIGMFGEEHRPGNKALDQKGAHYDGSHDITGDPQRQHRDKGRPND